MWALFQPLKFSLFSCSNFPPKNQSWFRLVQDTYRWSFARRAVHLGSGIVLLHGDRHRIRFLLHHFAATCFFCHTLVARDFRWTNTRTRPRKGNRQRPTGCGANSRLIELPANERSTTLFPRIFRFSLHLVQVLLERRRVEDLLVAAAGRPYWWTVAKRLNYFEIALEQYNKRLWRGFLPSVHTIAITHRQRRDSHSYIHKWSRQQTCIRKGKVRRSAAGERARKTIVERWKRLGRRRCRDRDVCIYNKPKSSTSSSQSEEKQNIVSQRSSYTYISVS